jgi:hypothetical protein
MPIAAKYSSCVSFGYAQADETIYDGEILSSKYCCEGYSAVHKIYTLENKTSHYFYILPGTSRMVKTTEIDIECNIH